MRTTATRDENRQGYNHGGSGQPIALRQGASLSAILKVHDVAPHGPPNTLKKRLDGDEVEFVTPAHK